MGRPLEVKRVRPGGCYGRMDRKNAAHDRISSLESSRRSDRCSVAVGLTLNCDGGVNLGNGYHYPVEPMIVSRGVSTMSIRTLLLTGAALIGAAILVSPIDAMAQSLGEKRPRSVEQLVNDVREVRMPTFDRDRHQTDPAYANEYLTLRKKALEKKISLIAEIWNRNHDFPGVVEMLAERWEIMSRSLGRADDVLKEVARIRAAGPDGTIDRAARYARARATIALADSGDKDANSDVTASVAAFVQEYPKDGRGAALQATVADRFTAKRSRKVAIYKKLILDYPDHPDAKYWPGRIRQVESIGQPFELHFTDALTGRDISMEAFRGRIVVINFWATWSASSIAQMTELKKFYEKFHSKGVEFVGINLDRRERKGDLDRLTRFCNDNQIDWPQFYQGGGWSSRFSLSWGINYLPMVFIVDQKGNLFSANAEAQAQDLIRVLLNDPVEFRN